MAEDEESDGVSIFPFIHEPGLARASNLNPQGLGGKTRPKGIRGEQKPLRMVQELHENRQRTSSLRTIKNDNSRHKITTSSSCGQDRICHHGPGGKITLARRFRLRAA